MRALAVTTPVVLAICAGCAQSDGPEERTLADLTTAQLARALRENATQLSPFVTRYEPDPTSAELTVLASRDRATGQTLVDVGLEPARDSLGMAQTKATALFRLDEAGRVHLLARIPEGVVPSDPKLGRRAVPGRGAIVSCVPGAANGVRLEGDAVVPFDDAPGACLSADVAGESLRPGRWLYLERSGDGLVTVSRSVRGEAPETRTLSVSADSPVVWAREEADGAVHVVIRTDGGFEWLGEGATKVTLAVDAPESHRLVFDDARDAFVIRAVDGDAVVWSPQRGTEHRLEAPAAPVDSQGWTYSGAGALPFAEVAVPNPRWTRVRVPQRYVTAPLVGDAVQAVDARLTPCADDARCRALGESYLLGTVDAATPLGLYVLWSWDSYAALVAAPLSSEVGR